MSQPGTIPFGPERKDPSWRWGSFLIGVAAFVFLAWIATLGGINLFGWWWVVAVVLGAMFSARSGLAWTQGKVQNLAAAARTVEPTVDVRGQAGSTYVVLEPARAKNSPKVRPREFGPVWWALYSIVVRAPVALGDWVLTMAWRAGGSRNAGAAARRQRIQMEQIDPFDNLSDPDREKF